MIPSGLLICESSTSRGRSPTMERLKAEQARIERETVAVSPGGMRAGVEVRLGPGDRERLEAVVGSGNSPQKHVWRARIVLLSAEGIGTMEIQQRTGKGKPTISRWQARFMAEGVDGRLHEATRPAGRLQYGLQSGYARLARLEGATLYRGTRAIGWSSAGLLRQGGREDAARARALCLFADHRTAGL